MTRRSYARIAVLVAAFLVAPVAREAQPQDSLSAEEREHAAAWGAHHLCAGLFVVGRDYQRDPNTVIGRTSLPSRRFDGRKRSNTTSTGRTDV